MRALALLVVVMSVASFLVASPAASQPYGTPPSGMGPGMGMGPDAGANASMMHRATRADEAQASHEAMAWRNLSEAQRQAGHQRAEQARLFARFTAADGAASGRFVSFGYDNDTGDVRDYTAGDVNATFFTIVHPGSWGGNLSENVHGAVFRMASDAGRVAAHNNPTALLAVRGADLVVTFELAAGVSAGNVSNNRTVRLDKAPAHGHIVLAGNGTLAKVDNDTLEATLHDAAALFMAHPAGTASGASLHERLDALGRGDLGGEIQVVEGQGAPVGDAESFGVAMRAERAGNRSVQVRVSSDEARGRAVVVRTDNATVPAGRPEEVRVLLDGVAMQRTLAALEALDATQGRGKAHVEIIAGGIQVIVNVAGFSEHVIEVQSAQEPVQPPAQPPPPPPPPAPPPLPPEQPTQRTPGPGFLAVLAAGAMAVALARRRR